MITERAVGSTALQQTISSGPHSIGYTTAYGKYVRVYTQGS